jgi:two-component system, response regulator YesN
MYKIMIADDESFERSSIRFMLNKFFNNIEIIEDAKTGNEAILLSKKYKPNIIIMDIKMPEKNGLEAHESIMKFLPNIKTIILTAYDDFKFAQTAIKLNIVDYILKPTKPYELKDSIEKIISSLDSESNKMIHNNQINPYNEPPLKKAIDYINKNFNKSINLNLVAKHIHFNPQYFSKYFKNNTGINFIEYLSKVRINNAKKLLEYTDKSIHMISMDVGYTDPSYFTKVFMKYEGISPRNYRQRVNSEFRIHNSQCTMNNEQFTVHNSQFTMSNAQITMHNSQFTMYDEQCTVHNL